MERSLKAPPQPSVVVYSACGPSSSPQVVSRSWPRIHSLSAKLVAQDLVLSGVCKLINWYFVLFFSFLQNLFPFGRMGTVVASRLPPGASVSHVFLKNNSWVFCNSTYQLLETTCFPLHSLTFPPRRITTPRVILFVFAIILISLRNT